MTSHRELFTPTGRRGSLMASGSAGENERRSGGHVGLAPQGSQENFNRMGTMQLRAGEGRAAEILYQKRVKNSARSAALDPFHNYFLLVDDGTDEFGGELTLRDALEDRLSTSLRVPRLQLVVQGGLTELKIVVAAIKTDCPGVLVKESGGCAQVCALP